MSYYLLIGVVSLGGYFYYSQQKNEEEKKKAEIARKQRLLRLEEAERKKKEEDSGSEPKLLVYYGSQTGTAEGFAKTCAEGAKKIGLVGRVIDLEEFDSDNFLEQIKNKGTQNIYCFCLATYGEGDPSDNAIAFHSFLKNSTDKDLFEGLRFTVFGLGNKQYEHFNQMGRFVDSKFQELGGTRVYKYGEGDDDGTLQEDFNSWIEDLHSTLKVVQFGESSSLNDTETLDTDILPEFYYELKWMKEQPNDENLVKSGGRFVESTRGPVKGKLDVITKPYFKTEVFKVSKIVELRKTKGEDNLGSTLHIELDLPESIRTYGTAFNIAILPENSPEIVECVSKSLNLDLNAWFSIRPKEGQNDLGPLFPTPCTVKTALSTCCALSVIPNKSMIEKLSCYATNKEQKMKLKRLSSKQGKQELHEEITEMKLSLWEFLQKYDSIEFQNICEFFEICPRLAAREYTIASSNKVYPKQVHLTVVDVVEKIPNGRVYQGVCTGALKRRFLGEMEPIYAFIKPSSFLLPTNPSIPIIMVGPGTGIAPMRALIQERNWQKEKGLRPGPSCLFFGCRREDEDYIYANEIEEFKQTGALTVYYVAFSRKDSKKKVYVQDLIKEQGETMWGWITSKSAYIYVCGATQMGKDVSNTFLHIAMNVGKLNEVQAKDFLSKMTLEGKYIQELY